MALTSWEEAKKEAAFAARTEDEALCGYLLGFMMYCMHCPMSGPDQNIVVLSIRNDKEARGRCETCGRLHYASPSGDSFICFDLAETHYERPLHILPFCPEEWEEMVEGEKRIAAFLASSTAPR